MSVHVTCLLISLSLSLSRLSPLFVLMPAPHVPTFVTPLPSTLCFCHPSLPLPPHSCYPSISSPSTPLTPSFLLPPPSPHPLTLGTPSTLSLPPPFPHPLALITLPFPHPLALVTPPFSYPPPPPRSHYPPPVPHPLPLPEMRKRKLLTYTWFLLPNHCDNVKVQNVETNATPTILASVMSAKSQTPTDETRAPLT